MRLRNRLFYFMCFLTLAMVIYRLAFCIPPMEGTDAYIYFCIKVACLAILVSGTTVGLSVYFDWYLNKNNEEDKKDKK